MIIRCKLGDKPYENLNPGSYDCLQIKYDSESLNDSQSEDDTEQI